MDGGETLQGEQLRHGHAAHLAILADVVAQQVHDHQVLGPVLAALQKLGGQGLVLVGVRGAPGRAFDGPGLHLPVVNGDKPLRR